MVSTHPTGGEDAVSTRATEYGELFEWVNGNITLAEFGTGNRISVPEVDYIIVCGDFNSSENSDQTRLEGYVSQYGMTAANGGRLGWFVTTPNELCLDNIICSSNITINAVKVLKVEGSTLYSDSYPLSDHYAMYADVILH